MGLKATVTFLTLISAATVVKAQTTKEYTGPFPKSPELSTQEPSRPREVVKRHKIKPYKIKRRKVTQTPEYEFYKRVEEAAKAHQRELKKLHQPQYSNFLYYGHRRPPKKHSPDKMRYCKECGIRH